MARKWSYHVASCPDLPQGAKSPIMNSDQMSDWLNGMDECGWEFVSYGTTFWHGHDTPQQWWIFRRHAQLQEPNND